MSLIAVYIPCKDDDEARTISQALLREKLVACAGMWKMNSLFLWKGELKDEDEVVIFAKSTDDKYEGIKNQVRELHSYELPAIIKIPIEANEEYEKWLKNELNQQQE